MTLQLSPQAPRLPRERRHHRQPLREDFAVAPPHVTDEPPRAEVDGDHVARARKISNDTFVPSMHASRASMADGTFGRPTRRHRAEMDRLALTVDTIHPHARLLWKEQPREHGILPSRKHQPARAPGLIPGSRHQKRRRANSDEQNRPHPGKLRRTATSSEALFHQLG